MTNKKKKKTKYVWSKKQKQVLGLILIPVIAVCIILIINGNKDNKIYIDKSKYNSTKLQEMFLEDAKYIELKIANILLDGSVTDTDSLEEKIQDINNILKKDNWDKLGIVTVTRWNGTWFLNKEGLIKFKFSSKEEETEWIENTEVTNYIEKN